jgi:hypothetical protein
MVKHPNALSVTFSEIGKSVIMKFFDLNENFRKLAF